MASEPYSMVVSFVLALFAAFAVPTVIAFVLFGILRREGREERAEERDPATFTPRVFPRHRFTRWESN